MSRAVDRLDIDSLPAPVCETCGGTIVNDGQQCPALDDGRCQA
jgi:hypothetical protein